MHGPGNGNQGIWNQGIYMNAAELTKADPDPLRRQLLARCAALAACAAGAC
jgi:hypothetical protein